MYRYIYNNGKPLCGIYVSVTFFFTLTNKINRSLKIIGFTKQEGKL